MENQHQKIKGYRDLSAEEIALMNEIKEAGEKLEALIEKVGDHLSRQSREAITIPNDEARRLLRAEPHRWLMMARSDLQVGIMKLVRAVAQPGSF